MTKQECAIITAYTGITMLAGDDLAYFYKYAERLIGKPLFTHEFANQHLWDELKTRSTPDFIKLCKEATDDVKS